jgi:hypothetical protein
MEHEMLDALELRLSEGARTSLVAALERQQEQSRGAMQDALLEIRRLRSQLVGAARWHQEFTVARGLLAELVEVGLSAEEGCEALARAEQYLATTNSTTQVTTPTRGRRHG